MDALRKSVRGDEVPAAKKKGVKPAAVGSRKGIALVKPAKASKSRKSA
jgi:hypothetical protein